MGVAESVAMTGLGALPDAAVPADFLVADPIVDSADPGVRELAERLDCAAGGPEDFARAAFERVRDEALHSYDVRDPRVTLTAAEVFTARVGLS